MSEKGGREIALLRKALPDDIALESAEAASGSFVILWPDRPPSFIFERPLLSFPPFPGYTATIQETPRARNFVINNDAAKGPPYISTPTFRPILARRGEQWAEEGGKRAFCGERGADKKWVWDAGGDGWLAWARHQRSHRESVAPLNASRIEIA